MKGIFKNLDIIKQKKAAGNWGEEQIIKSGLSSLKKSNLKIIFNSKFIKKEKIFKYLFQLFSL